MARFALLLALLALVRPAEAQLARGHAKFLGNVYSTAQLPGYTSYWNQVTPENAGKWGSVEPQRDAMNWTTLDAVTAFAQSNGFPVRYHVLVWGNQQPGWIESLPPDQQLEEIEEWFAAVAGRYPNLDWVEVVNEPLHDPPNRSGDGGGNYYNALGGAGTTGWDWILNAFRMARRHFPSAKLMINDYGILGSLNTANQYLAIINLLKTENLIDGIGVQGHAFTTVGASATTMTAVLDRLAQAGLPIQVTEFEIDGSSQAVQWNEYKRVFPVLWEHPAVEGMTLWGWRSGMWRTAQGAPLIADNGTEKLALGWLRTYLRDVLADADSESEVPGRFELGPAYPNPFNPEVTLPFTLDDPRAVTIRIHDALGRLTESRSLGFLPAGRHEFRWNASDRPTGMYLVSVEAGADRAARAVSLVR